MALVRVYQWVISPAIHALAGAGCGCRFYPTCSEYARECLAHYGFLRGSWLALKRVSRCHPWNSGGFDPVPVPLQPLVIAHQHRHHRHG
ncbi:MAG: membrane protein insertion efficiency factor YidD [Verrucomicrobiota bacterium]|nr:membrane protein insertion efficiency factor YidD [Verrucomicrobiota bacterium]